jgi:hypothetical protein
MAAQMRARKLSKLAMLRANDRDLAARSFSGFFIAEFAAMDLVCPPDEISVAFGPPQGLSLATWASTAAQMACSSNGEITVFRAADL